MLYNKDDYYIYVPKTNLFVLSLKSLQMTKSVVI